MTEHLWWLVLWGTMVGLDLISVAQVMIARPLVAGTIAGFVAGDPAAGAAVGAILELFALDVLPVGAARYPDYGIGAVAAAVTSAGAPWLLGLGLGVIVGLVVAHVGGVGIHLLRLRNAWDVERHSARLERGDPRMIARLHMRALSRDAVRAFLMSAAGIGLAVAVRRWFPISTESAVYVATAALGAGVAGAVNGAIRVTAAEGWLLLGFTLGIVGVVLL